MMQVPSIRVAGRNAMLEILITLLQAGQRSVTPASPGACCRLPTRSRGMSRKLRPTSAGMVRQTLTYPQPPSAFDRWQSLPARLAPTRAGRISLAIIIAGPDPRRTACRPIRPRTWRCSAQALRQAVPSDLDSRVVRPLGFSRRGTAQHRETRPPQTFKWLRKRNGDCRLQQHGKGAPIIQDATHPRSSPLPRAGRDGRV